MRRKPAASAKQLFNLLPHALVALGNIHDHALGVVHALWRRDARMAISLADSTAFGGGIYLPRHRNAPAFLDGIAAARAWIFVKGISRGHCIRCNRRLVDVADRGSVLSAAGRARGVVLLLC